MTLTLDPAGSHLVVRNYFQIASMCIKEKVSRVFDGEMAIQCGVARTQSGTLRPPYQITRHYLYTIVNGTNEKGSVA